MESDDGLPDTVRAPLELSEVGSDGKGIHVRISGELDVSTVDHLRDSMSHVYLDGQRLIVLDLSELTFCDARGQAALLTIHEALKRDGRHLAIRNVPPLTRRLFTVTGIDQVLDIS